MPSSIWKLLTAAGIIGIGTLVVLEVQSRLPVPSQASPAADSAEAISTSPVANGDVVPDATTELDKMLSGVETFDDTRFAMAEPASAADHGKPVSSKVDQAYVGVSPVSRTVLKDTLTDDENPFNRPPASDNAQTGKYFHRRCTAKATIGIHSACKFRQQFSEGSGDNDGNGKYRQARRCFSDIILQQQWSAGCCGGTASENCGFNHRCSGG